MSKATHLARTILSNLTNKNRKTFCPLLLSPLRVVSASDDGQLHCQWKVDSSHLNKLGTLHGGCTASIFDLATALSFFTMVNGKSYASVDLKISYSRPAREGELLDIHSKVTKAGKSMAFLEADIVNEAGKLVATGKQTVLITDNPSVKQYIRQLRENYVDSE